VRKTVFLTRAAGFALALAVGGCDLLQKITDTVADAAGSTPEVYYPDDTGVTGGTAVKDNTDDTAVYADFYNVYAEDGSFDKGTTTTRLVLCFWQTVAGLTAENITLIDTGGTGIQKGELWQLDDAAQYYRLAVSGIGGKGDVTVEVAAPAGYKFSRDGTQKAQRTVLVNAPKTPARLTGVEADGIAGWKATKALYLQFGVYPNTLCYSRFAGLTAADIMLIDTGGTGIQKGVLLEWVVSDTYYLAVSGITKHGLVTVKVAAPEKFFFVQEQVRTVQVVYGTE
jgi:hypothetical protein